MHDGAMAEDGATLSEIEDLEAGMDSTPHDHSQGPPSTAARKPRGPPPPLPVGPTRASASGSQEPQPAQPDGLNAGEGYEDNDEARQWPVMEICEGGRRFLERVQGPRLPNGRFAESSSDESGEDSGSSSATGAESLNSLTWSETSLCLVGPSLQEARGFMLGQFRMELHAVHPTISSRSQGGRVGALRRKLQAGGSGLV